MTKINDHINFRFQQLEEKLSNSSANSDSINPIPSQASPITKSVAFLIIAGAGGNGLATPVLCRPVFLKVKCNSIFTNSKY